MADEWISLKEAAEIVGVSDDTARRWITDPTHRLHGTWGAEGVGWRRKPLSGRGDFQIRKSRALKLAAGGGNLES